MQAITPGFTFKGLFELESRFEFRAAILLYQYESKST
jgi:hypothetical protein